MVTEKEIYIQTDLYKALEQFIETDTKFSFTKVYMEKSVDGGKSADIFVESKTKESLVIETKRDDTYLLDSENIKQARDYAKALGHSTFALANSKDFFLFDYDNTETHISDIDFYYLNLREHTLSEIPKIITGAVESIYDMGELPEQVDKEKIIGLLRNFQSHTYPTYKALIEDKIGSDRAFRQEFNQKFESWVNNNDYQDLPDDEQLEILSKQHTYALTNRLLFYKLLKDNKVDAQYNDVILNDIDTSGMADGLQDRVESQFKRVVDKINYEPIFDIEDNIFELIPHSKRTDKDFQQLLRSFKQFDLTEIDEDLIGQLYEELIPAEERKRLGQFYTPPSVAETIVKWSLETESTDADTMPRVLDPACGSGTFPVEIYKELDSTYDASHQEIINNISVVDINKFPLHLTGINLTSKNITEPTNHIDSFHGSFFDYPEPDETELYDAVVGNPPYISGNDLHPDKDHFRKHLQEYNPDGNKVPEYYKGTKRFSKKTDAYIYFITNAIRYLKDGGRLGVIVPSKWMETKYGQDFQQFLFDNVRIKGIISFSKRTFEDADVNTSILLVEKESSEEKRNNTVVDFIKVTDTLNPDKIVSAVNFDLNLKTDFDVNTDMDNYNVTTISQEKLKNRNKWTYLHKAPERIIKLIESDNLQRLDTFAEIQNGTNTGANTFFFITQEEKEKFNIESDFLVEAIKSYKSVKNNIVKHKDNYEYIINTDDYITENNLSSYSELKESLKSDGCTGILRYLETGVNQEIPTNSVCKKRDIWCQIESMTQPDILHPETIWNRFQVGFNTDNLVVSHAIRGLTFEDEKLGFAMLNSHTYQILIELWGITQGANSLKLPSYRMRSLPFPDITMLTDSQKEKIYSSYNTIVRGEYNGEVDEVILELLEMEDMITVDELRQIKDVLRTSRTEGIEPEVLIDKNSPAEEAGAFEEPEDITLKEFV